VRAPPWVAAVARRAAWTTAATEALVPGQVYGHHAGVTAPCEEHHAAPQRGCRHQGWQCWSWVHTGRVPGRCGLAGEGWLRSWPPARIRLAGSTRTTPKTRRTSTPPGPATAGIATRRAATAVRPPTRRTTTA